MIRIEEQIRSARPDLTVALSASAGSGKTRALVMRLMHLLFAGARPDSIAAVTFTDKAAAEMKDRLFSSLKEAAANGLDAYQALGISEADAPYGLPRSPANVLSELISRPDSLKVQTIHALCLWLIRRFSAESGILPDFAMADEAEASLMMDRAVEEEFAAIAASDRLHDIDTLISHGMGINTIKGSLIRAIGMRSQISAILLSGRGQDAFIESIHDGVIANRAQLNETLAAGDIAKFASDTHDILTRYGLFDQVGKGYADALASLVSAGDEGSFRGAFVSAAEYFLTQKLEPRARSPVTLGSIESSLKVFEPEAKGNRRKERAKEIHAEHDALWSSLREVAVGAAGLCDLIDSYDALSAFFTLFADAERRYSQIKETAGLADFDDLEIGAHRLLYGPHSQLALLDVEPRLRHYLVDEFQDTSGLQWRLISQLAAEVFSGMGAEGIAGSTLFAVGDAKQSIYRFRNANYRLLGVLKDAMAEKIAPGRSAALELTANFRSAPEILGVVDETFSEMLGDLYSPTTHMDDGRAGSVRLSISGIDEEYDTLARLVSEYAGIEIHDHSDGKNRGARYSDMAVLVRSRRLLPGIEDAFNGLGIPYQVVGGVGFFDRPEVASILGLLRFVYDPDDGLGLEAALRSRLFGMSASEAHIILFGGEYEAALARSLPDAFELVEGLRSVMGLVSCGEVVDMAISRSDALGAFSPGHPTAHLNLEKLRSLADDFDGNVGGGFGEFLRWLNNYETLSDISAADPDRGRSGQAGAVSIMTVHAAKGLEFPVVFIPGCARKTPNRHGTLIVGGRDYDGIALKTNTLTGGASLYEILRDEENGESASESARLLYVAMTRARDHLILTAEDRHTSGKKGLDKTSWLARLIKAAPQSLFGEGGISTEGPVEYRHPGGPPCYMESPDTAGHDEYRPGVPDPELLAPLSPVRSVEYATPSSLAAGLDEHADTTYPWPAMLRGSIVHAALEAYGVGGAYNVSDIASRYPGFHNLGPETGAALVADIDTSLASLLENSDISNILRSGDNRYYELPLMVRLGDTIVGGSADLISVTRDAALVVDYKTGLVGIPSGVIADAYRPQLSAYAEAVREAFGSADVKACLILTDCAEVVYL